MKARPYLEKFEEKFVIEPNGCWRWTAHCNPSGHGEFWYDGTTVGAHRISWILHRGKIPVGVHVLHKPECDHPWCVNPDHLYLGTHADNMSDKMVTGSSAYGSRHFFHGKKLDRDDVACIKKMLRDKIPEWLIAWIYQVKKQWIYMIRTGQAWKTV